MKTITMLGIIVVAGLFLTTGCASCCKKDAACAKPAMTCNGSCCKDGATCAKCCTDAAGCAKCCKN